MRLAVHGGAGGEEGPALFSLKLAPGRTRIGRTDDCDIVLPDDAVSRSHCIIEWADKRFVVIDRSSNGTFINEVRVDKTAPLEVGAVIRVGSFRLRVCADDPSLEGPTSNDFAPEIRHETILDSASGLAVAQAWLDVTDGPSKGKRFRLRGAHITVGGPGSQVVVPDGLLARDHLRVRLNHGRAMVEAAAGSAFVCGSRLRDVLPILEGEDVMIGASTIRISWDTKVEHPTAERFGDLVGKSLLIRQVHGALRRMAGHPLPVLILGESGTGKELAARALHHHSPRQGLAFVAVNCGAITPTLFESELFGHEKGSFTGATERRDGAFQRADGGTLFLDEIGELPEEAQAKLLRALESGEVRRVGGDKPTFPDVRVIAATNRPLHEDAKSGRFRSDLYFRLAVLAVRLPALRERREDIPVIARELLARTNPKARLSPAAEERLLAYDWPGNARELRNVLTRALVMSGPDIEAHSIMFSPFAAESLGALVPRESADEAEREIVVDTLRKCKFNRSEAARLLGMPRSSLLYKLQRWGLEKEQE